MVLSAWEEFMQRSYANHLEFEAFRSACWKCWLDHAHIKAALSRAGLL